MGMKELNYAHKGSWLFLPEGKKLEYGVDVFFVYPTVYAHPSKSRRHNMNPKNLLFRFFALMLTLWRAKIFAGQCNVFVPHYRQAGIEILDMDDEEARPYSEIAYGDVRDAFRYYMENLNGGRPFILAGHSQGSEQLLELMKREFAARPAYMGRFIASYIIGYSVTKDDLREHPHLKIAEGEADTGSIITYNTSAVGLKLMRVVRPGAVCVNPLNWVTTSKYAPKKLNIGSVLFDFGKYFKLEKKNFTGAYIDTTQGVLMIDRDALNELLHIRIGFLNRILIHRGTLHMLDIALFHRNLQKNVRTRIDAFLAKSADARGQGVNVLGQVCPVAVEKPPV